MTTPRYVPILKGRQGELDALREVQPLTRQVMTPLLEVAPKDETEDPATVLKICEQTVDKLRQRYLGPIMLDVGRFDLDAEVDAGRGVLAVVADAARAAGLVAQPVVRLGDPSRALREAREAIGFDGRGMTLRLGGEDLDEEPDELDDLFDALLDQAGSDRRDVDLVLDVGSVDGDVAVRGAARMLTSLIRDLPSLAAWRSLTIAAGAFPVDLSQFTAYVVGERPRYDAQLYDRVRNRTLPRYPDYGDYGVAHPTLAIGNAFSPPPQLR